MNYVIIFFICFTVTAFATPFIINILNKSGIVDKPDERKVHSIIIPRMGGIIIFPVTILLIISFYPDLSSIRLFLISIVFFLAAGVWDDIISIHWAKKAFIHSWGVIILMIFLESHIKSLSFFLIEIPRPFDYFILFLFILGTVNSFNLIDGLDGLAAGYSLLVVLALFFIAYGTGNMLVLIISTSLLGSLFAMLRYNSFPAVMFLGDTGSILIGALIVFSSLSLSINSEFTLDLTFPVLLLGVSIIDTVKVMAIRILETKNPFLPDKKHLHHLLIGNNIRHKTAVFIIHLVTIPFLINAIFYFYNNHIINIIIFVLFAFVILNAKKIIGLQHYYLLNVKNRLVNILGYKKYILPFYIKLILPASLLFFFLFLSTSVGYISSEKLSWILLFISIGVLLLAISVWHEIKERPQASLYFFLNIAFILFSNQYYSPDQLNVIDFINLSPFLLKFIFYFFLFSVFIFVLLRGNLVSRELNFLNGTDLFLLSAVILVFLMQNIFGIRTITHNYNFTLFFTVILYFWYKIYSLMNYKFSRVLYYLLFAVNLLTLSISLFYSN